MHTRARSAPHRTSSDGSGRRNDRAAVTSWMASTMLVLPTAFGPTTIVSPGEGSIVMRS